MSKVHLNEGKAPKDIYAEMLLRGHHWVMGLWKPLDFFIKLSLPVLQVFVTDRERLLQWQNIFYPMQYSGP